MNTKSIKQYIQRYSEYKNQEVEYNKKLNQIKRGGETQERTETLKVFGFRMIMRKFDLLMMGQKAFFANLLNRILLGNIKANTGRIRETKGSKKSKLIK